MQEQYLSVFSRLSDTTWQWLGALQPVDALMFLAALLAVAAVFLFIRSDQTARHRIEREFQLRSADREFALRREVYLPAAEAIARTQDFLARMPGLDISKDQAQVVVDHVMGALGKAQLVASEASLRPLMAVATEFTNSYLALAARRQPIAALKTEIAALTDRIEQLSVERDHQLSAITRMAGAEANEQAVWNDMNLRFDKLHRELSAALDQRKSKLTQKNQLEHEFTLEAAQASLRLAKLAVPAYLALRDELRLDIDEAQYRAAAQKNIGEIERHLRDLAQPQGDRKPAREKAPARREPVIKMDEPVHEKRLRMVLKRSG